MRAPRSLIALAALVVLAGHSACGSSSDRAPAADGGSPGPACAGVPDPPDVPPTCPTDSQSNAVWGQEITVAAGTGDAPSPMGGTITPGWYVLVSKTVFGGYLGDISLATDLTEEAQAIESGIAREVAFVSCGALETIYTTSYMQDPPPAGETCRALVPRAVPLAETTYSDIGGTTTLSATPGRFASYTAAGDAVTLISNLPVTPMNFGPGVVGSYTIVDRFVLASTFKPVTAPGTVPVFDASPGPFAPGERDPRCPGKPPAEGDPCNPEPVPLQCEYGGDAWARCTTVASCGLVPLDGSGAFQFDVSQDTNCAPNPSACPADFAAALSLVDAGAGVSPPDTTASGLRGPSCNYPEGVCGYPVGTIDGACGWMCRQRAEVGAACPPLRPLAGTPCSNENLACPYNEPCSPGFTFGPDMVCQFGHWAIENNITSCGSGPSCPASGADE